MKKAGRGSGTGNEGDGVGGDGETAADVVGALVGGGFYPDAIKGKAGAGGEAGAHFLEARGDLGPLGDERGVDVLDLVAAFAEGGADALEQDLRIDVFEGRIGVGEKMTDVGQGGGAEKGVADGMGERVGVGVAVETNGALGEMNAAENHGATGDGAVDVVAVADAEGHGGGSGEANRDSGKDKAYGTYRTDGTYA